MTHSTPDAVIQGRSCPSVCRLRPLLLVVLFSYELSPVRFLFLGAGNSQGAYFCCTGETWCIMALCKHSVCVESGLIPSSYNGEVVCAYKKAPQWGKSTFLLENFSGYQGSDQWQWPVAMANGNGQWQWPVAMASGNGQWQWPVAMTSGNDQWQWPVAMTSGNDQWHCLCKILALDFIKS